MQPAPFIQALGARSDPKDARLPGHSLFDIAQGYVPQRTILSEYHAAGAPCVARLGGRATSIP